VNADRLSRPRGPGGRAPPSQPAVPTPKINLRALVFIVRCTGAATVAYELATWLRLPHALWAAMSALIVSQAHLHETRSSFQGRILGTLLGLGVAVLVGAAAARIAAPVGLQIALAVAICALVAHYAPKLRVAMWTCPVVLLPAHPSAPLLVAAYQRGCEVILGGVTGWAFHWAAERFDGLLPAHRSGAAGPGESRDTPVLD
jgi:uncharacterized membrane protein YccC